MRADERKFVHEHNNILNQKSTLLEPMPTMRKSDVKPMPKGRFVEVVIPLYYEGHVYRAGSRIRVTISAPNGTQPIWAFGQTDPAGTAKVSVAFSGACPRAWSCRSSRGERADRPAGVPEPAQRAVPALRGDQNRVSAASRA